MPTVTYDEFRRAWDEILAYDPDTETARVMRSPEPTPANLLVQKIILLSLDRIAHKESGDDMPATEALIEICELWSPSEGGE